MKTITTDVLQQLRSAYEADTTAPILHAALAKTDMAGLSYVPGAAARLYTAVDVQDERQLAFYEHNGFKMDYTEDLVRLNDPDEVPQLINCSCITLPLNTVYSECRSGIY